MCNIEMKKDKDDMWRDMEGNLSYMHLMRVEPMYGSQYDNCVLYIEICDDCIGEIAEVEEYMSEEKYQEYLKVWNGLMEYRNRANKVKMGE